MTLNELKKEVLSLMFESDFDSHEAFVFATNRALAEIHSERPRTEVLTLRKKRIIPNEYFEKTTHEGGKNLMFNLSGVAVSFTVAGTGRVLFADGVFREEINFSGTNTLIKRKLITGNVFLWFFGDFDYDIYNLASFATLSGDKTDDIPLYEPYIKYDMSKIAPLFLSFSDTVRDSAGKEIPNLKTEGSLIFVPAEYEGDINISYVRLPKRIAIGELDTEIDVPPDSAHLVALRCAAYLLLDGNEGLAEYYLSLYKSGISAVKYSLGRTTGEKFSDVLGWA